MLTLTETIERQTEIIKMQAEIIDGLFLRLAQELTVKELSSLPLDDICAVSKLASEYQL